MKRERGGKVEHLVYKKRTQQSAVLSLTFCPTALAQLPVSPSIQLDLISMLSSCSGSFSSSSSSSSSCLLVDMSLSVTATSEVESGVGDAYFRSEEE